MLKILSECGCICSLDNIHSIATSSNKYKMPILKMDGIIYLVVPLNNGLKVSKKSISLLASCQLSSMSVKIFIDCWENIMSGLLASPFSLHFSSTFNLKRLFSINMFVNIQKNKMMISFLEHLKEYSFIWYKMEPIPKASIMSRND